MLKKLNLFCLTNEKIGGSFLRKNHFLRCWGWVSLLNWIGAITLSLLPKLLPRKLELWFVLWSFFLLMLLCIPINLPYNHTWNTVAMSGLLLLAATLNYKWATKTDLSVTASRETLAHRGNVASLNLFYRYYFGRCSSELAQLVPLPYSRGRSTRYSDRCYKDVYVNSFFLCTTRLWNSLPIKLFPLNFDLNRFTSRVDRHLLTVGSF